MSIINHGVPAELVVRMVKISKEFFHLPLETKMSIAPKHLNPSNKNTYRGYIPSSVFGKECLDIADPSRKMRDDLSDFTTEMNKIPEEMTKEKIKTIEEYFTALHRLVLVLIKAVFRIYGAGMNKVRCC